KSAISNGNVPAVRANTLLLPTEWHFAHRNACRQNGIKQFGMFRRIEPVEAAGEYRDSAAVEARSMGGGIDATRKAGDSGEASFAKRQGKALRNLQSRSGGVARS